MIQHQCYCGFATGAAIEKQMTRRKQRIRKANLASRFPEPKIGELQSTLTNHAAAAESFRRALQLSEVGPEQAHLARRLTSATGNTALSV